MSTRNEGGSGGSGSERDRTDISQRLLNGLSQSHFIVETETRVVEVVTNPAGRTTLMLRRVDTRTWPKETYQACESDFDRIRDTISDLDLKRDHETITGWDRQKQAA